MSVLTLVKELAEHGQPRPVLQVQIEQHARQTSARHGCARQTSARHGCARQTSTRHGCARQASTRHGCARQTSSFNNEMDCPLLSAHGWLCDGAC